MALKRYVTGIVNCPDIAEDLVQDTFVKAYAVADQRRSPQGLFFTTAHRLAIDHIRRANTARQAIHMQAGVPQVTSDLERDAIAREEFDWLCTAVANLPPQQRKVYVLRKVYNLSYIEIAEEMGLSPVTVKNYIAISVGRVLAEFEEKSEATPPRAVNGEGRGSA
ncbi:RNA polymerase sigma factor [Parasphingopyxis algicola]|uniref:RNA polymerase sigma factor n=1 Tax=Parasphingopyxis algicola TaxID=2026624 RepID=UPI00159FB37D|nr:RNA polymerase sigma factor [Parasphingopyxis algicola]QLC24890.1 RNA polymerase sigma factor [Parasphingopyxis algicola]